MDLAIEFIGGHGDATKEFVKLRAKADINLKNYFLADTSYNAKTGSISNVHRHGYLFADKAVKSGESVVLWTGTGTTSTVAGPDKLPQHNIYWGSKAPIWNDDGDYATLIEIKGRTGKVAK